MEDLILFFIFLFLGIFDAAVLPRLSFLNSPPLLSLAVLILYWRHREKGLLWAFVPASIFSIYSGKNLIWIFLLFAAAYIAVRFFGNQFKENRHLKSAIKGFSSIAIFTFGKSIIFLCSSFKFSDKNTAIFLAENFIFLAEELIIFFALAYLYHKISIRLGIKK